VVSGRSKRKGKRVGQARPGHGSGREISNPDKTAYPYLISICTNTTMNVYFCPNLLRQDSALHSMTRATDLDGRRTGQSEGRHRIRCAMPCHATPAAKRSRRELFPSHAEGLRWVSLFVVDSPNDRYFLVAMKEPDSPRSSDMEGLERS
jgi:hypothetical protein